MMWLGCLSITLSALNGLYVGNTIITKSLSYLKPNGRLMVPRKANVQSHQV